MNPTPECCVVPNAGASAGFSPRGRRRSFFLRALLALSAVAAVVVFAAPAERAMAQTDPATTPVQIPDANLRTKLETALSKSPGATITRADMATNFGTNQVRLDRVPRWFPGSVPSPPVPANVIRDLTGLGYLTRAYAVNLNYNRITDLRPLAGLTNTRRLWLRDNLISDLSPLTGLILDHLQISGNPVSDLSPLAGQVWLATFYATDARITDLSPLAGLTRIRILDLQDNSIRDISPLTRVNDLSEVYLSNNLISDLSPLANRNLRTLAAANNRITDLSPLRNSLAMETLDLNGNEDLRDVSVVERMVALRVLRLEGTDVRDLSPLVRNAGLGSGDQVYLRNVPNLNADAEQHIVTLRSRGVYVRTSNPLRLVRTVRGVRVTPGVEKLTVTWNPLIPTTAFNPSGYRVYWWSAGARRTSGIAGNYRTSRAGQYNVDGLNTASYTIPNLTPGVGYKVRILPGTPWGDFSAIVTGTPLGAQTAPAQAGGVTVTPGVESLIVSWIPVADANGYKVQWKSGEQEYDPATRQALVSGADATSHTIPGLTPGTEYTVRVIFTKTDASDGEPSDEATGTPVGVAIDDAAAMEGDVVEFRVRLTEPAAALLTLVWTLEDVTATAREDYRPVASGRLTFRPGEKEKTLRVQTLQDRLGEAAETFRLRLAAASNGDPPAAAGDETGTVTAIGTILDDDAGLRARAMSMALAGMGRWVAADAVDVIEERFTGSQATEAQVGLGGRTLPLAGVGSQGPARSAAPGTRSARYGLDPGRGGDPWTPGNSHPAFSTDSIARSRFNLPLGRQVDGAAPGGTSGWRVWGQGSVGGFDGKPEPGSTIDGEVVGGYLGLDYRPRQDALVGVALAHSRGEVDYAIDSVTSGEVDLDLTSVLPYAHWSPRAGMGAWGLLGAGWGRAELKDYAGKVETDLRMWMAAAGLRQDVASWREIDLALKADGFLTELKTEARAGLPEAKGEARRLRLRLEGRREWEVSPVSRMTPRLELGGRWDGGAGEDGLGMEVGGGLAYTHTDLGLEVEARGRFLLAHQANGFGEWGGSLTVTVDPGQAGQGPWMRLSPGWGREGSRVAQMWDGREAFRGADGAPELSPNRLSLDVGWGLPTHGGAGLLTPYAGLSMSGSEMRDYRMGARMKTGSRMSMGLEGRRRKAARNTQAGYEVLLTALWNW